MVRKQLSRDSCLTEEMDGVDKLWYLYGVRRGGSYHIKNILSNIIITTGRLPANVVREPSQEVQSRPPIPSLTVQDVNVNIHKEDRSSPVGSQAP